MSQNPQQRKDSVFLYMHSKGMVNHGNMTEAKRAATDGPLFKYVIEPWRDVLFRFKTVPQLEKAGFTITRGAKPGGGGVMAKMQILQGTTMSIGLLTPLMSPLLASMVLEEFKLGVCFTLEGTINAFKSNRKTRLGEEGVFNCTDPKQNKLVI